MLMRGGTDAREKPGSEEVTPLPGVTRNDSEREEVCVLVLDDRQ